MPYTRVGVLGGILLGFGRALGETMAVTFVIGNSHHITASILQPGTTIWLRSPTSSPRRSAISTNRR